MSNVKQLPETDSVLSRIRHKIISGEIPANTALSQSALAREFGVSRIPVRDALHRLTAEGLVIPGDGHHVNVTPVSVDDLQEIYELRERLEPLAVRLGLPGVGRAQLIRMERSLDVMHEAADDQEIDTWLSANAEFHRQLFAHAPRRRLVELIDRLTRETDRYLWLHLRKTWDREQVETEHLQILKAAKSQDAGELEERSLVHLKNAHATILDYLMTRDDD